MEQLRNRLGWVLLLIIALALVTFGRTFLAADRVVTDGSLKLWIFNIGQGDSILIDTPNHHQILTDGGRDNKVLGELRKALLPGDNELDLVVSTHDDADHLGGLNYVLENYTVDKIWLAGAVGSTKTYQKFISLVAQKHIPVEKVRLGSKISLDGVNGIVVSPAENFDGVKPSLQNATSIVTFWQYGQETFLLTGDAEVPQEQSEITRGVLRHVDILKVSHHGSHTGSSEAFLEAITPKIAAISVGLHNPYGHPHQEVIDRLNALKIPILRTDQDGTIEFSVYPNRFTYATHR